METVYGRIENGTVVEWAKSTPFIAEGEPSQDWRPLEAPAPEYNAATHQLGDPSDTVQADKIVRTWPVVERPSSLVCSDKEASVNCERDRRLAKFTFEGKAFNFVDGKQSDVNIAGAGTLALAAIIAGAQPNDLRWADPANDFVWVADDNTLVSMDAQTCLNFAKAAAAWKAKHIYKARSLKDMPTIPDDYAADARWS